MSGHFSLGAIELTELRHATSMAAQFNGHRHRAKATMPNHLHEIEISIRFDYTPFVMANSKSSIVYAGKHLQVCKCGTWEFARRPNVSGIVGIVAVTDKDELVLIRQYRPPLNCDVIEIPAGLAGDIAESEDESLLLAAKRELLEETGFRAGKMKLLTFGTSSAGLTNEVVHLFLATDLKRIADSQGDATEHITTHLVPLAKVENWIKRQQNSGAQIDLKVYSALHFARAR